MTAQTIALKAKDGTKLTLKKAWQWFNGKKSFISIVGLGACQLGLVKNNVNPDILEAVNFGFTVIGGIGVIHRDWKSDKSIIKRVGDSINKGLKK
jgi:hypothetical protein